MFSTTLLKASTKDYSQQIKKLAAALDAADAVVIGAGAGLSTAAGYTYSGERFERYFPHFKEKYGFEDMYSGGFYPYRTKEERWGYWWRNIYANRYTPIPKNTYEKLLQLVGEKDYFVITTNVDHCFQRAGFDKSRLFYTQGDYGLFQCSPPCKQETFDNEDLIAAMRATDEGGKIPTELIPKCPHCGREMTTNLRVDNRFVEDAGWHRANERYGGFLRRHQGLKVLFLELGVGSNTPVIIKYPFWEYTAQNPAATYACLNFGEATAPLKIEKQAILLDCDIDKALEDLINRP